MVKRGRRGERDNEDRLSDLPDCILLHILSSLSAKHAVQTCVLSTRWKDLWKRLPTLILHSPDFSNFQNFTEFVSTILTLRDGSTALNGLDFKGIGPIDPRLLERIGNYAVSHNVERLGLDVMCGIEPIPPCIFSCHTLTSLKLSLDDDYTESRLFPKSLDLPALTTLHLENFAFSANGDGDDPRAEPFSGFTRLNSLILDDCDLMGNAITLCISNAALVNLTVLNHYSNDLHVIKLSCPNLRSLVFKGTPFLLPSGCNLSSLEQVNIDAQLWPPAITQPPMFLLSWLQKLAKIKSLTVSRNTLQVLSIVPDILKMKSPLWDSLKTLKIKREPLSYELMAIMRTVMLEKAAMKSPEEAAKLREETDMLWKTRWRNAPLPDGIVNFLIQNSPLKP